MERHNNNNAVKAQQTQNFPENYVKCMKKILTKE